MQILRDHVLNFYSFNDICIMRILIVENEEGIASFLKQGLEEESYAVDVANEGKKGQQLALDGEYDLLLLD